MKLTPQEALDIVCGDDDAWREEEDSEKITGHDRWNIYKTAIFEHTPDHKFYRFSWGQGATEIQDTEPFEYEEEYEPTEVVKQQRMVYLWVNKDLS